MRILTGLLVATLSFSGLAQEQTNEQTQEQTGVQPHEQTVEVKPKVAVTDLAYEKKVKDYINVVDSNPNTNLGNSVDESTNSYHKVEGTYTYINQTELHKFVGDVKGEIKKSGLLDLIQGRPYSGDPEYDNIHDIIARIDQGDFEGADYVLFGRLSDIQFSENVMNIQHTNTYSKTLNLTVVAEFNLINTQTHEIKAAFTAKGEGKEIKLMTNLDQKITLNRANLVSKASKSLGKDVLAQLEEQLTGKMPDDDYNPPVRNNIPPDEPPTIIRRK